MEVKLCPKCGSGKIANLRFSDLDTVRKVRCMACPWEGETDELLTSASDVMIKAETIAEADDQQLAIARKVSEDYLNLLAKYVGKPIGLAMIEAGVIGLQDTKVLTRLIKAAAHGAHTETFKELEKVQEEIANARAK